MITTIIFDAGGVLTDIKTWEELGSILSKKYHVNKPKTIQLLRTTWRKARVNKISSKLFWTTISDYLSRETHLLRQEITTHHKMRPHMLQLITALKRHYTTGLLSNHIEDWLEETIANHHLEKYFDAIVTSYGTRAAKPSKAIYRALLRKMRKKPEECIFIDDQKENVIAAKKLGIHGIHYRNFNQFKKELAAYGIVSVPRRTTR
ncbi:MAG: HAD family phosphatase [Patescibacteria group bacterium]